MSSIGERIRAARKELGLTMQNLHDLTGLSTGNISDMENDRYMPSVASLVPLSNALNRSIDWLITGEERASVTQNSNALTSEHTLTCDDVPLTESEADLVAMYRLMNNADRKTVFDIAKLKYEQAIGEKESIYSTFSDAKSSQKNGHDDAETAHEIA